MSGDGDRTVGKAGDFTHVDLPAGHRRDGQGAVVRASCDRGQYREVERTPLADRFQPIGLIGRVLITQKGGKRQRLTAARGDVHAPHPLHVVKQYPAIAGEAQAGTTTIVVVHPLRQRRQVHLAAGAHRVATLSGDGDRTAGKARDFTHVELAARHRRDEQRAVAPSAVDCGEQRKAQPTSLADRL